MHFWGGSEGVTGGQEFVHEGFRVAVKEEKVDIVLLEYFEYVGTREG